MRSLEPPQRAPQSSSRAGRRDRTAPAGIEPSYFLQMPGNLAVQNWFRTGAIQAKLRISQPGEADEREADRIADRVMSGVPERISAVPERTIHRKCTACAAGGAPCADCDHEEKIAPKPKPGHLPRDGRASDVSIPALRGGGAPLPSSVRSFFEPRFGYDLGGVRIHTDGPAAESARAIQARAYTLGNDIVFDRGEWTPDSPDGRHLLAHELTHVIQQQAAPPSAPAVIHRRASRSGRLDHDTVPAGLVSRIEAVQQGTRFGQSVVQVLMQSPSHPAWQPLRVWAREQGIEPMAPELDPTFRGSAPSELIDPSRSGLHDSEEDDEGELAARFGVTRCALAVGLPYLLIFNTSCSAPCTVAHEGTHLADIAGCCIKAGIAYRAAATPADKALVASRWAAYISSGRAYFECRAYGVSVGCADTMLATLLCWAPASIVQKILVGGGALAGGIIGAQILGGAGAGAGAATGGTAGAVGGPVGAGVGALAGGTAGFISGEVLGFLGGAAVGAAAGAAADAARQACCTTLTSYRANAVAQRAKYCGAGGGTPVCPF